MKIVRQPRRLSAVMTKVTAKIYRRRGFSVPTVLTEWAAIVGPQLAAYTVPERLSAQGTLRVRVDGPVATELQHLEPQILERIAGYFGYRAVHRLSLVRAPLPKPAPAPEPVRRAPLTSKSAHILEDTLEGTRDGGLRDALARLGRAVLSDQSDPPGPAKS